MFNSDTELLVCAKGAPIVRHVLPPGDYTLGRAQAAITIDAAEVSSPHARLILRPGSMFIEDLGSAHGTFVQGQPVAARTPLLPGQRVRLGAHVTLETRRLDSTDGADTVLTSQNETLRGLLRDELLRTSKYTLGPTIGMGGMGTVLRAEEIPIRRTVAMKVMRNEDSETELLRFVEEAQVTGQLEHPNIVPVHELGLNEEGRLYFTMKFVRGATLHEVLRRLAERDAETVRRFPLVQLLTIFQKVCDAVAFAHSKGVIHRDLKPANLMIGQYGEVLVMDWGLAKVIDRHTDAATDAGLPARTAVVSVRQEEPASQTLAGTVMGTPHFMSPEQARGEGDSVDSRSDIYSLGAILYQILSLRPPVSGSLSKEVLANVCAGRIEPLTGAARDPAPPHLPGRRVPEALAAVALKALSVDRDARYQTVPALQAEITAYQGGFATHAQHATTFRQFALAVARYKRESIVAAVFLLLLLAVGTASLIRVTRERNTARLERARSEDALAQLRGTAPAFLAHARALAMQERFAEAIEKLDYALQLNPASTEFLLLKADLFESQMRLRNAAETYRRVLALAPGHERAGRHAALCERLLAAVGDDGRLPRAALAELFNAMLRDQRPAAELIPLARLLGEEKQLVLEHWRNQLRALPIPPEKPIEARLTARPDGLLGLDLRGVPMTDLQMLAGMPLGELNLAGCSGVQDIQGLRGLPLQSLDLEATAVADLQPLRDSRMETLSLKATRVTDLSPLAGLPLRSLDCSHTPVFDCAPLAALPLETLVLAGTRVRDLSCLRGLPLRALSLEDCREARSLAVLPGIATLETLILPRDFFQWPAEDVQAVQSLLRHPRLRQITAAPHPGLPFSAVESTETFWKEWENDLPWLIELRRRAPAVTVQKLPDRTWDVNLHGQALDDLSCLRGAPISKLWLFGVSVRDLAPLAGLPLRVLDLRQTGVTDLAPLTGLPLAELYLWQTRVTNFSVVSSLPDLEIFDAAATAFSDLRVLTNCHRLLLLRIGNSGVTDLSPLAGLPLQKLHADAVNVADLSPLLRCPKLKWVVVPKLARNVEVLRQHPAVELISYGWLSESRPNRTAAEFWRELDAAREDRKR